MFQEEWRIAGKIPAKGISCCRTCPKKRNVATNDSFLSSLDELIAILFAIFSENGDITRRNETFLASVELVKKVLSSARLGEGIIYFSFPKKIRKKNKNLPTRCAIKLKPGVPTQIYTKWMNK